MFLCDVAQALMPAASALLADACLRRYQGEAIALIPENAARVALVVGEHRKAAPPPRTVETQVGWRLDVLEQRCNRLLEEFEELSGAWRDSGDRMMLGSVLARTRSELERLSLELGA